MTSAGACEAFVSAPIKLAAKIDERGRKSRANNNHHDHLFPSVIKINTKHCTTTTIMPLSGAPIRSASNGSSKPKLRPITTSCQTRALVVSLATALALLVSLAPTGSYALVQQQHLNSQLINHDARAAQQDQLESSLLRHHAHYLNFVPSAHFSYNEGRQANGRSLELAESNADPANVVAEAASLESTGGRPQLTQSSHIYKRSSAVLMPPVVGAQHGASGEGQAALGARRLVVVGPNGQPSARSLLDPLSRRMMAQSSSESSPGPSMATGGGGVGSGTSKPRRQQANWSGVGAPAANIATDPEHESLLLQSAHDHQSANRASSVVESAELASDQDHSLVGNHLPSAGTHSQQPGGPNKRQAEQEAELLRQKQHIQYHDQWPSMAGKCHKRTLNFCASVLPFNTTTFPNIIGDTNRFEVKRSLPFFGFLAKSSCNKRLDELLCLLLEPPCSVHSGSAIPPCKKFCRLALEGCNEYIPATLALSSVFDCRQYPDSNDPSVCINLAQGSKCAPDEFKCPDKTCIPRNWVCDGVRDCIFAADEANCTDSAAVPHASVCSTEEFKCDGKCVPKAWKCDGERDCQDGSDEESCDLRPKCGPDRFRCADGNGCIPKRWVCDGKAECRDGSDEMNCNQRECSENDFKCDNGICIPKLWRCDRQFDCKDGSDERQCVYPTPSTTTTTKTTTTSEPTTTTTTTQTPTTEAELQVQVNASSSYGIEAQLSEAESSEPIGAAKQQLEMSLGGDVSRIIQHERDSAQQQATTTTTNNASSASASSSSPEPPVPTPEVDEQQVQATTTRQEQQQSQESGQAQMQPQQQPETSGSQLQVALARELKKFDYDLIPSAANMVQMNELPIGGGQASSAGDSFQQQQKPTTTGKQPMMTQIDFVTQQQQAPVASEQQEQIQMQQQQANQMMQQQQQQQVRGLNGNFGPAGPAQAPVHQQEATDAASQRPQQPPPAQQRVPIYRSLFKSFKGHHLGGQAHHRLQLDRNGSPRNVVAVARRRRDRHQQPAARQQHEGLGGQMGDSTMMHPSQQQHSGPMMMMMPHHTQQQHHHHQQQQQQQQQLHQLQLNNQTRVAAPAAGEVGGSVASYLQLLNGRYNLRLPRVGGGANSNAAGPAAPQPAWT